MIPVAISVPFTSMLPEIAVTPDQFIVTPVSQTSPSQGPPLADAAFRRCAAARGRTETEQSHWNRPGARRPAGGHGNLQAGPAAERMAILPLLAASSRYTAIVSRLAKPCGASPSSNGVVTSTKVSG